METFERILSDNSLLIAKQALEGLGLRRDVVGQNISNVDTPSYKAQEVNFETTLQSAMKGKGKLTAAKTNSAHLSGLKSEEGGAFQVGMRQGGSSRADGNNVDIDQELLQLTDTGIRYQALTSVVSKKLLLLKSIAQAR
jgi:flagellar basal-body rod protein FlgB